MSDEDEEITVYIPEELRDSIHEYELIREEGESEQHHTWRRRLIGAMLNTAKIVYFDWPPKKH
jgi:hypothetical protein